MSDLTTTGAARVRDGFGQDSTFAVGSAIYVALHSGDPGSDGSANEITTASGYSRAQTITPDNWDPTSNGDARGIENNVDITYDPSGDWPDVTHVSLTDDQTNGDHLAAYQLDRERKNIIAGDTVRFRAGELKFDFD